MEQIFFLQHISFQLFYELSEELQSTESEFILFYTSAAKSCSSIMLDNITFLELSVMITASFVAKQLTKSVYKNSDFE